MNPEVENLINMAIADGEVTEKERAIILRKAEILGLDKDEVEMILDGKIALTSKEKNNEVQILSIKNNKECDLNKCPSCGASVQSFSTKCPDCAHEFRNIDVSNVTKEFFNQLQKIVNEESNRKGTSIFSVVNTEQMNLKIVQRQVSLISSFPVPNTKEDILEFLSMAIPEASKKVPWNFRLANHPIYQLKLAYLAKCEQIIMKARFSMKEDKNTLDEIEYYAKQVNIK